MSALNFDELRDANAVRVRDVFHPLDSWTLTDWACAAAGEMGEACNIVKKIHRGDFGPIDKIDDDHELPADAKVYLEEELADVVIYLDLLAARARIDLGEAVRAKFNLVSMKRGSDVRL